MLTLKIVKYIIIKQITKGDKTFMEVRMDGKKVKIFTRHNFFRGFVIFALGVAFALSYVLFVTPNDFAPSGINGIAVMVQDLVGFSVGYLSLLINVPLSILAFFFINKEFAIKTFLFCIAYSLGYLLFDNIDLEAFKYYSEGVDTIYPVILAGMACGVCYGVLYKVNSSTGGTDIIAKFVGTIRPEFNFFWINFTLNACVAVASYFVYTETGDNGQIVYNFKPVCLCLLYTFVASFVGNRILTGSQQALKYTIITTHAEEIANDISNELKHTSTRIIGYGSYTKEEKGVLIAVVNKSQRVDIEKILARYDNTFSVAETANKVMGNFRVVKKQAPPPQKKDNKSSD